MKKHLFLYLFLLCIIIISQLTACDKSSTYKGLDDLGIDKSEGYLNCYVDTHGGFHGDGCTYIELKFAGEYVDQLERKLEDMEEWIPLPLTKNLSKVVFGDQDFVSIFQITDEIPELPKITQGYYYFKDRHSESTDSASDADLFNRYSFNFDLIIYDIETHILYIFQLDT